MKYAQILKNSTQRRALTGEKQVQNSAGGFVYAVDEWMLLDRFLILGSESGTYYIGETKLTLEHAENVVNLVRKDGVRVVERIVAVSRGNRAPKNDPAIFALAIAASYGDDRTRIAAFDALPRVCRTGTHLFAFAESIRGMRGWGRGLRKAIGNWYNVQDANGLAYGLVKYQSRNGWSNRDLLRLAHPKPISEAHRTLYKWVVDNELQGDAPLVSAVVALRSASIDQAATLIRESRIPREAVPTELLREPMVWEALLENMPLTAMLRNLANMTRLGVIAPGAPATAKICAALTNAENLKKARVHPLAVLNALGTYAAGRGVKADESWTPVTSVIDALNQAFYAAFVAAEGSGKRVLYGLDVSGSMAGTRVAGMPSLDCRKASGAFALVAAAVEKDSTFVAFDTEAYPLSLSRNRRLDDVVDLLAKTGGGGTDCAKPVTYALAKKIKVDAFVIVTDSETWAGEHHPIRAVEEYRRKMGIPAKLVVVAMASNRFTLARPKDPMNLDVIGLDPSVPGVIAQFLRE